MSIQYHRALDLSRLKVFVSQMIEIILVEVKKKGKSNSYWFLAMTLFTQNFPTA